MPAITANVEFDTVALEIRCKWSEDNEKASLSALQEVLNKHTPTLKTIPGVKVRTCTSVTHTHTHTQRMPAVVMTMVLRVCAEHEARGVRRVPRLQDYHCT